MDQDIDLNPDSADFTRVQLAWGETLQVGSAQATHAQVVQLLAGNLTDERRSRLDEVVRGRSTHVVSVLENIYDRGNVSAVMRSAEAFGFLDMSLIDAPGARFKAANRVTRGAEKWLDVKSYSSATTCVSELKERGYQVWATDLQTDTSIATMDWSKPTAIVLGNEKDGITQEMREAVDGCFRIPMMGFSQSFNISVAAALIFYHAHLEIEKLGEVAFLDETQRTQVLANYYLRCFDNPESLLKAHLAKTTSK